MTQTPWNIEDPIVQRKMLHLVYVHQPEFICCEAAETMTSKWKSPVKVNNFVNAICEIQRKSGRRTFGFSVS